MNIDISNAHCGPRIQFPDHAWLRVVYNIKTAYLFFSKYIEKIKDSSEIMNVHQYISTYFFYVKKNLENNWCHLKQVEYISVTFERKKIHKQLNY